MTMTNDAHAHHDYDGEDACWTTAFRGVVDSHEMARGGMKGHLLKELTVDEILGTHAPHGLKTNILSYNVSHCYFLLK